jgi:uncharacterized coiled-coil DUF342 family protein
MERPHMNEYKESIQDLIKKLKEQVENAKQTIAELDYIIRCVNELIEDES